MCSDVVTASRVSFGVDERLIRAPELSLDTGDEDGLRRGPRTRRARRAVMSSWSDCSSILPQVNRFSLTSEVTVDVVILYRQHTNRFVCGLTERESERERAKL